MEAANFSLESGKNSGGEVLIGQEGSVNIDDKVREITSKVEERVGHKISDEQMLRVIAAAKKMISQGPGTTSVLTSVPLGMDADENFKKVSGAIAQWVLLTIKAIRTNESEKISGGFSWRESQQPRLVAVVRNLNKSLGE